MVPSPFQIVRFPRHGKVVKRIGQNIAWNDILDNGCICFANVVVPCAVRGILYLIRKNVRLNMIL
jgi:hypothetical protein